MKRFINDYDKRGNEFSFIVAMSSFYFLITYGVCKTRKYYNHKNKNKIKLPDTDIENGGVCGLLGIEKMMECSTQCSNNS